MFDAARPVASRGAPRPTIADAGGDRGGPRPGAAVRDRSLGLDAAAWRRFAVGLKEIVQRCRDRGCEPAFHHETGTYVEAPWEIDRVLELTDVGLCLDTGHLILGGGDPVSAVRDWGGRINQGHPQDARPSVMADVIASGGATAEVWAREAFPALGQGGLDAGSVLTGLRAMGYV